MDLNRSQYAIEQGQTRTRIFKFIIGSLRSQRRSARRLPLAAGPFQKVAVTA